MNTHTHTPNMLRLPTFGVFVGKYSHGVSGKGTEADTRCFRTQLGLVKPRNQREPRPKKHQRHVSGAFWAAIKTGEPNGSPPPQKKKKKRGKKQKPDLYQQICVFSQLRPRFLRGNYAARRGAEEGQEPPGEGAAEDVET